MTSRPKRHGGARESEPAVSCLEERGSPLVFWTAIGLVPQEISIGIGLHPPHVRITCSKRHGGAREGEPAVSRLEE